VGLSLNGHYFVANNLSVGLGGNFFTQTQKEDGGEGKYTTTLLMGGPQLRYYINTGAKSKVWLKGMASFGSAKSKYDGEWEEDPTKLSEFGGGIGLALFPNQHFCIDLGIGYNVFTVKNEYDFEEMPIEYKEIYSGLVFDIGFGVFF
jgi:hypothetical protein